MKVLINSVGSIGDVNPFLSLGLALQQRGHKVIILSTAALKEHIQNSGLPMIEVLTQSQYDRWRNMPTNTEKGQEDIKAFSYMSLPSAFPSASAILEHCDKGCVVLGMPMQSIGVQFAKAKAPDKILALEAELAPRIWDVHPEYKQVFNRIFSPYLNSLCQHFKITMRVDDWLEWLRKFDQKLAFYPKWFDTSARSIWGSPGPSEFVFYKNDDQAPLSAELEQFITNGEPPIAFTFGSYTTTHHTLFNIATKVCQQLGKRAIFLTKYPEQLPNPLPEHIFHASYVSLQKLLPKVCLFVHHGGIGTLAQGLRAGIPHITCPMAYDQFDNAKTLESLNVSQTVKMENMNQDNLYQAIKSITTDPTFMDNAKTLASNRFNSAGEEKLCDQIERLFAHMQ